MNIIATVKQVADPNFSIGRIQLDPSGKRIISSFGVPPIINGYDSNALEEALQLRAKHGGRVTVLCVGDDSSRQALKRAIAMGADNAVLINEPEWLNADSAGLGYILAAAIRKIGLYDLILCGRQASDTDAGQVLFWIADALQLPVMSPISKVEESTSSHLTIRRLTEEGHQRLRIKLPAVIGISSEINEPRFPSIRGTSNANRALIPGWKAPDLGLKSIPVKVELQKLEILSHSGHAEFIEATSPEEQGVALANKLHELGLI